MYDFFYFAVSCRLVQVQIATFCPNFHFVTYLAFGFRHYFNCHCFRKRAISAISFFYFVLVFPAILW